MKNKWLMLAGYWFVAVCIAYGAIYLGHLALKRPHGFQDLWDHAVGSGTGMWIVAYFLFWRKGNHLSIQ